MSEHTRTARERAANDAWLTDLDKDDPVHGGCFDGYGSQQEAFEAGFLARDAEVAAEIRTARSMELEDAAESYRRGDRHPWAMSVRTYLKRRALQVRGEQS